MIPQDKCFCLNSIFSIYIQISDNFFLTILAVEINKNVCKVRYYGTRADETDRQMSIITIYNIRRSWKIGFKKNAKI